MPTYPTYKLGDVAEIILGQSPESKSYNTKGEGLPFFQGKTEFTDWFPIPNKSKFITSNILVSSLNLTN